mmetsp:Transcript_14881/g.24852  ORF Transcript_14881/g.24852 Transcript_14881/m.24852 type:complete len:83 (-) Transcript_14881:414-662(-)|eukprot:CAMPEP_0119334588 /NCGR_PEP_ID=MMETSP1333-20130426/87627_1 /TAXON_ID=418940 /ORGANISM="Scyphosphaera apsteinii, Strain RCC1455" /LENGTH=82 /DNA_ID=CAMNT_0007344919 /DNA_START=782 /DNA_END=1030 /DNA_ORIENTATION=-
MTGASAVVEDDGEFPKDGEFLSVPVTVSFALEVTADEADIAPVVLAVERAQPLAKDADAGKAPGADEDGAADSASGISTFAR